MREMIQPARKRQGEQARDCNDGNQYGEHRANHHQIMILRFFADRPYQKTGDSCRRPPPGESSKKRLLPPMRIEAFQNEAAQEGKKQDPNKQHGVGKI